MPTPPARPSPHRPRRHGWRAAVPAGTAALLLAVAVAGCTGDVPVPVPPDLEEETRSATVGPVVAPGPAGTDPRFDLVQDLLDRRARAVREGDLAAFTADLAGARGVDADEGVAAVDPGFRRQQVRWFRNLQRLPVGRLSYEVGTQEWSPDQLPDRRRAVTGVFLPVVTTTLRLRGFDDRPVSRTGGITLARTPGGYRVVAVDDVDGTADAAVGEAPWDLVELDVRRQRSVGRTLLLLDQQSASSAPTLLPLLARGTEQVLAAVPFPWSGEVVTYATGEQSVIAAIDDVPGGDVAQVGALSFPVYEGGGSPDIAAFRFALNPEVLASDPLYLRRLVTHELTHVALGTRDDGAPTWVSEGVAEYVGALGLAPTETRIAVSVVERAREVRRRLDAGEDVDLRLPPSRTFNGPEADWHYGLSWYAAEWVVAERGSRTLWRLVREAARGTGTPDDEQDAVLRSVLGIDGEELARRAVDLILATYDA